MRVLILLFFFMVPLSAPAEYRAFLLRISKRDSPQDYRLVPSTLDPLQYPRYYPVQPDEVITYDDTWKCRDRTGDFKPICPSPRAPAGE